MKKFLLGTIGLVALGMAAPASAADLARPSLPGSLPPLVAAIYDWSGFYIGAQRRLGPEPQLLGFRWGSWHPHSLTVAASGPEASAGGQLGYRWQAGTWVFGLEGQGDWADLSNTRVSIFNPAFSTRTKTDGIGLFTGQIGWALWNTALLYVKGGAAVTSNRFSILARLPAMNWPRQARPAGVVPWASDGSGASLRIGRPVLNTITSSWVMQTIRSRYPIPSLPVCSITGSAKTWIWSPCASTIASAVTAAVGAGRTEILTSSNCVVSSKLGRQKCRPFCLSEYV